MSAAFAWPILGQARTESAGLESVGAVRGHVRVQVLPVAAARTHRHKGLRPGSHAASRDLTSAEWRQG